MADQNYDPDQPNDKDRLNRVRSSITRYFSGLTENTFHSELGVVDPTLVEYLSSLLVRSIRSDMVHRFRTVTGRPLMSIHEMMLEATARLGDAKRDLHQHIGDFALFWAGLYPEALRRDESGSKFETYCSYGKRSYRIASEIESANDHAVPSNLLERLSERFDLCCYGLREIRRQWETGEGPNAILLD